MRAVTFTLSVLYGKIEEFHLTQERDSMVKTSEYCAPGHPDRMCDSIVSYILDRMIEECPRSRVALECQAKDNYITISGEVTFSRELRNEDVAEWTKQAIRKIGYTEEYAAKWGEGNTIDPLKIDVVTHISTQSPDIAQGVDNEGWGDQGIFWGMATPSSDFDNMPKDYFFARKIGLLLWSKACAGELNVGLDIKTQVTMSEGKVLEVIVAAPMKSDEAKGVIEVVSEVIGVPINDIGEGDGTYRILHANGDFARLIINGTGAYVRHSTMGDCGTTGRKLVVDSYGGNCRIGGGCYWGKDPTKADVTLNVLARAKARYEANQTGKTAYCSISCCIGRKEILVTIYDEDMKPKKSYLSDDKASVVINSLGLNEPRYFDRCLNGIFR